MICNLLLFLQEISMTFFIPVLLVLEDMYDFVILIISMLPATVW